MKYDIVRTNQFKRDYKLIKKRGYDLSLLAEVIGLLTEGKPLPEKYEDHPLTGNWAGHRDCHILSDWLLVYRFEKDELVLVLSRTGTHSDDSLCENSQFRHCGLDPQSPDLQFSDPEPRLRRSQDDDL